MTAATSPATRRAKAAPRSKRLTSRWAQGDVVQTGSTRWAIRTLRGQDVELEALNRSPRIRWYTTLDHLPEPSRP